jgi:hypothetical protein
LSTTGEPQPYDHRDGGSTPPLDDHDHGPGDGDGDGDGMWSRGRANVRPKLIAPTSTESLSRNSSAYDDEEWRKHVDPNAGRKQRVMGKDGKWTIVMVGGGADSHHGHEDSDSEDDAELYDGGSRPGSRATGVVSVSRAGPAAAAALTAANRLRSRVGFSDAVMKLMENSRRMQRSRDRDDDDDDDDDAAHASLPGTPGSGSGTPAHNGRDSPSSVKFLKGAVLGEGADVLIRQKAVVTRGSVSGNSSPSGSVGTAASIEPHHFQSSPLTRK